MQPGNMLSVGNVENRTESRSLAESKVDAYERIVGRQESYDIQGLPTGHWTTRNLGHEMMARSEGMRNRT